MITSQRRARRQCADQRGENFAAHAEQLGRLLDGYVQVEAQHQHCV
ncbi:hypothetical protein F4553_001660 [Allocatelliglobosispora scoriae]|uniref:Uncharacterized protein n=1 Tax=Allocatelliglobosispora scoriae TaxID=643052 RepID=A0A841BN71_9ACTN|nr:hypothetical protein [Allocatelliglobosispora scoriae]MBB5868281.1 hypothetical protein [Allocatelliglobosispora scoriae]